MEFEVTVLIIGFGNLLRPEYLKAFDFRKILDYVLGRITSIPQPCNLIFQDGLWQLKSPGYLGIQRY
jgi:hypothetical protein